MHSNNVVPKIPLLTEEQFRNNWLAALGRLCREYGDSQVALWLGVTERHLRTVRAGTSLPTADKIWNLLAYDASAHDELDGAYDAKNVPKNSVCSTDPLTLDMIAVAHEVAQHENPASHGGVATTDHELREKDEARLRRVYRVLGSWVDRLDRMRGVTSIGRSAAA